MAQRSSKIVSHAVAAIQAHETTQERYVIISKRFSLQDFACLIKTLSTTKYLKIAYQNFEILQSLYH